MYVRDLYAACVGFVAACALFALQRYLVEPTLVLALLLVASAAAFVVVLVAYAAKVASRERTMQPPPILRHRDQPMTSMNGSAERSASVPLPARSTRAKNRHATA